jgi:replicative DNA helicase
VKLKRTRFDAVAEEVADDAPSPSWKVDYGKDFERRMLRVLYADQEFATTSGVHLSHEYFSTPSLRWMAQKIVGFVKEHGVGISKDALNIELDRDIKIGRLTKSNQEAAKALVESIDVVVKDRTYVKAELFKFIKNQVVDRAIRASIDHLDAQDFDSVDSELQKVLDVQQSLDGGLGHFFVRDRLLRRDRRRDGTTLNGISTGLFLDNKLKPKGLPPKSLTTVVAPSGVGKSGVLMFITRGAVTSGSAEKPIKALYVTTELSEEVVCDRLDASFTGVSINMLEKERKAVSTKVRGLGKKYGEFLVVKEFPPASLTPNGLRAYIRQLERVPFYPSIIIVDSADDMVPDNPGRDRDPYEDYGSVWRGLRKVSYDTLAPVVTASQTQRGALNKEHVDWDFIADSAKKVMVSDVVLMLQQTKEEHRQKVGRFYIAKNRFGSAKSEWKVRLDWARIDIRNI